MTFARLGPLGSLMPIPAPMLGSFQTSAERASVTLDTLGGRRVVQKGARAKRTWLMSRSWCTPEQAAFLTACAQGVIFNDLYLYTVEAARTNLLAPHVAAPGVGGDTALGVVSLYTVGVPGMGRMLGVSAQETAGAWSTKVPVLPSTTYTLSCWASAPAELTTSTPILDYQVAGDTTLAGTLTPSSAVGVYTSVRSEATFTTPAAATFLQVRTAALSGPTVTALRLTEGTPADTLWLPGAGAPTVTVDDAPQTLRAVWADQIRSDYAWTIREVG